MNSFILFFRFLSVSRASLLKESHLKSARENSPSFPPSLLPTSGLTGTRHGKFAAEKIAVVRRFFKTAYSDSNF
jgi:hypothetical protein